jgi:phospholipid/cholesterol/gamma-HCH transport system permease protein
MPSALGFLGETFVELPRRPFRFRELLRQLNFMGSESVLIICFCVCFAAMVTVIESSYHMKLAIQNDSMVPGFAALLILRELGVVVTALLLTSRVGAGIAAEVGTMKITEQIEALQMLGIRPVHFIVIPRLIAGIICGALLTVIANGVCIYATSVVAEFSLGFTSGVFISGLQRFVKMSDLYQAVFKGACFGGVIPLVSCYFGFRCENGAEGVGNATTKSVVTASVIIIILDFLLSFSFSMISF